MFRDLRYAIRGLLAQPAFTVTAVVTLALAVGVNALMLDTLDRLLVRAPTGVRDADRITRFYHNPASGSYFPLTSEPNFLDLERGLNAKVDAIATFMPEKLTLGRGASAKLLHVIDCSAGYFDVLGLRPTIGVLPGRHVQTPDSFAVISHSLWQRQYGGASDVLGRALSLGTQTFTIVGVAPTGFTGVDLDPTDVWLPIDMRGPQAYGDQWRSLRQTFAQQVIARIRQGVSRVDLETLATAIYRRENSDQWNRTTRIVAGDLLQARAPGHDPEIDVAMWIAGVSGLVLLIGCGNVGGLVLARGIARSRESAVKASLGATRWRLIREVLTEALLIGTLAGAAAMVLVAWGDAIMPKLFSEGLWTSAPAFDLRVAALTSLVSIVAAVLLGAIPALRLSSASQLLPARQIAAHGAYSMALDGLLAVQVALTVPLLVGAALFTVSFDRARHQKIGFDVDRMAVVTTNLYENGEPQRNHDVHRALQQRLAAMPQVEAASVVMTVPLLGGFSVVMDVPDSSVGVGHEPPFLNAVDPSFLKVAGIKLLAGRPFDDRDNEPGARRVAVVNDAMARTLWPGKTAIGRCLYLYDQRRSCVEVVGVVADAWMFVGRPQAPSYLLPIEPFKNLSTLRAVIVRTMDRPDGVLDALRREAHAVGPDLPYIDIWAFEDVLQPMLRPWKLGASMFVAFGVLALAISAIGLAGTIAYAVGRRRRELGVRKALGAQSLDLVRVVVRRSVAVVVVGVLAGLIGAYAGAGALKALLFGVRPDDWRVFAGAASVLLLVAGAAALVPARQATRIDPSELLRSE